MKYFKTFEKYKYGVNGVGSLKNSLAALKRQNITGRYVDPETLAQGIRNEYEAITGEKYEDEVQMSMDNTIADIIGHYKLDGPEFMAAWDKVIKESVNEAVKPIKLSGNLKKDLKVVTAMAEKMVKYAKDNFNTYIPTGEKLSQLKLGGTKEKDVLKYNINHLAKAINTDLTKKYMKDFVAESVNEAEFKHINKDEHAIKLAIKDVEKKARLKANRDKPLEYEQLSLNKIMLSKVLGREKLGKEHQAAWEKLKKEYSLKESVTDASNNLEKIFGTDQETMDMFQGIEDKGTVKDMIEFIDEFGNEEALSRYGIKSTAQVKNLAKTIMNEAKGGQIMPGDYVKNQHGNIYQRVDGKVGGHDAYVRVTNGKSGKRKTGLHDSFKLTLVNKDGLEESINEAERYITDEFKVGDKIKTNFGEWEVIEIDYAPKKSFIAPFIFKGKDMKRVNIPNPPKTNKNAVGYKVTDGAKYPTIGFLYQYKDITKLATVGVDESVMNESYKGNFTDFKYDLEMAIDNMDISPKSIKSVKKKGKGYEVRLSSYMSDKSTWEKIGDTIGATLISFKPGSINIGIYE